MWLNICNFFRYLFQPSWWIMSGGCYSDALDKKLNELMDNHKFERIGSHTASIGGVTLWISNYPYAAFTPYGICEQKIMARRSTIERAHNKMISDLIPEGFSDDEAEEQVAEN